MALGRAIRRHRVALGLSQKALAAISGVHPVTLSRLESGNLNVSLETIHRLSAAMKIKTSELLAKAGL